MGFGLIFPLVPFDGEMGRFERSLKTGCRIHVEAGFWGDGFRFVMDVAFRFFWVIVFDEGIGRVEMPFKTEGKKPDEASF